MTDVSDLPDRVREVREALAGEGIALQVLVGAELGHDMVGRLDQAELELLAQGPPHARWLLLETPFEGLGWELAAAARELRERGFACVLQLNAGSLDGRHGIDARRAAFEVIERFPCVISSDAHGRRRRPSLSAGLRAAIAHGVRHDAAHWMVDAGPRALLLDGLSLPRARAA